MKLNYALIQLLQNPLDNTEHALSYYVYKHSLPNATSWPASKKINVDILEEFDSEVCYAKLASYFKELDAYPETPTGVCVTLKYKNLDRCKILSKEDILNWIKFAKLNKLLPYYIDSTYFIKTGVFNIEFTESNVPIALLFIYLTMLRYIKENPELVKATLLLQKDYKISFIKAFYIAHCHTILYNTHTIINKVAEYGKKVDEHFFTTELDIKYYLQLKEFLDNPRKFDNRCLSLNNFVFKHWDCWLIQKKCSNYIKKYDKLDMRINAFINIKD